MQAFRFAAAFSLAALISAPAFAQTAPAPVAAPAPAPVAAPIPTETLAVKGDMIETLRATGRFNIFLRGLDATNLTAVIKGQPALTVFAPTDDAFASLPPGELSKLTRDNQLMQQLLMYHVINASIEPTKFASARASVPTVAGAPVVLDGTSGTLKANDATITIAGVKTPNGLIYVVDKVLTPQTAPAAAGASAP